MDGGKIVKLSHCVPRKCFFFVKLTGRPCTRQTKAKMAKSRILAKLGWVDQLIGGVDHTKYFCPEVTLIGVRAHPNFELTKINDQKRLKNCPILTKIGIQIDKTSNYYHAKFYQNRTNLSNV